MSEHEDRARAWLRDTPYFMFPPSVNDTSPPSLPMTIATPEKVASLAAEFAAVAREERERAEERMAGVLKRVFKGAGLGFGSPVGADPADGFEANLKLAVGNVVEIERAAERRASFELFNDAMNEFTENLAADPAMARETMKRRIVNAIAAGTEPGR